MVSRAMECITGSAAAPSGRLAPTALVYVGGNTDTTPLHYLLPSERVVTYIDPLTWRRNQWRLSSMETAFGKEAIESNTTLRSIHDMLFECYPDSVPVQSKESIRNEFPEYANCTPSALKKAHVHATMRELAYNLISGARKCRLDTDAPRSAWTDGLHEFSSVTLLNSTCDYTREDRPRCLMHFVSNGVFRQLDYIVSRAQDIQLEDLVRVPITTLVTRVGVSQYTYKASEQKLCGMHPANDRWSVRMLSSSQNAHGRSCLRFTKVHHDKPLRCEQTSSLYPAITLSCAERIAAHERRLTHH